MPLGVLFVLCLGIMTGVAVRKAFATHANAFIVGLFGAAGIGLACSQADVGFWHDVFRSLEDTTVMLFSIPIYILVCMSFCTLASFSVRGPR